MPMTSRDKNYKLSAIPSIAQESVYSQFKDSHVMMLFAMTFLIAEEA